MSQQMRTERGRYSEGEGRPSWQRMTNLLKHIDTDTYYLDQWKLQNVLIGTALREDVRVAAAAIGKRPAKPAKFDRGQRADLDSLIKTASDAAVSEDGAALGTAQHTACDRIDSGEPLADVIRHLPYPYNANVQAYEALVRLNKWEVVLMERTVRMSELGAAGTFDRVYRIPGVGLVIGDEKTEEDPLKNLLKITAQLGGYANSDAVWDADAGEWVSWEDVLGDRVRTDIAVVVHIRDGDAVPYFVNIARGYEAALRAAKQRDEMAASKTALGAAGAWAVPMPNIVRPKPAELAVQAAVIRGQYPSGAAVGGVPSIASGTPVYAAGMTPMRAEAILSTPEERQAELIKGIWRCIDLTALSTLYEWNAALPSPVPWVGAVEMAGAARRRQVECPQRVMHVAGTVKCACGWTPDVAA